MKKLLFLVLASFLVLAACGNEEESKLDDKKETKASDKESKKNDKKKDDDDKSDDKSNEEIANEEPQSQEQQTTEQPVESQEQVNTQEQQPIQSQEEAPVVEEQPVQQEPTDQEKMEANAKVAKEHGYTGIPNGDAGLLEPADEYYSNDQLDPETGLPMDDAVPHKTNE
ncbi:MAG: hypothetical protein L0L52_01950 [Staphylococcus equorum]|uniref:hypothetical protein n=1 Tax=Staphylococcus TaxID=1279 RepID=UPI0025545C14|nr:hypothetical protein [Staphylococcus equorum]MDK9870450.1 hypothetical protein [Staphylococcus equorum]MDK9878319.1 hypothetical protein [Staphylococcus equorum]MDN6160572.1 hypothetical protein [Staphylococcus equorum]MDN6570013.1 hypothetical protein [Staphylococcus equorum]MDN6611576.1 hypothetical protein [Staphylococcus equorum]